MKTKHTLLKLATALALALTPQLALAQANTAYGTNALPYAALTSGNAAFGDHALFDVVSGQGYGAENAAFGIDAMHTGSGIFNVALGYQALYANIGDYNIGIGQLTLASNTGTSNIGVGSNSLQYNTSGYTNIAIGSFALNGNLTGSNNIAIGTNVLSLNSTMAGNIGIGCDAMDFAVPGAGNVVVGDSASSFATGTGNTALGASAGTGIGDYNIAMGYQAGSVPTGNYNIHIGNLGVVGDNLTIRIGDTNQTATYITGIAGAVSTGSMPVFIDGSGKLGTTPTGLPLFTDVGVTGAAFILPGPVGSQPPYTSGNAESFTSLLQCTTTSSANTVFTIDGAAPVTTGSSQNVLIPPGNRTWMCRALISGRNTSTGANYGASWGREVTFLVWRNSTGGLSNGGMTATTILGNSTINAAIGLVTTGGYVSLYVTGVNSTAFPNVKFVARLEVSSSTN